MEKEKGRVQAIIFLHEKGWIFLFSSKISLKFFKVLKTKQKSILSGEKMKIFTQV